MKGGYESVRKISVYDNFLYRLHCIYGLYIVQLCKATQSTGHDLAVEVYTQLLFLLHKFLYYCIVLIVNFILLHYMLILFNSISVLNLKLT